MKNVVKVNIFLSDMTNFAAMNRVYDTFWDEPKPVSRILHLAETNVFSSVDIEANEVNHAQCRTCVAVKELPMKTDVEIECIAHL